LAVTKSSTPSVLALSAASFARMTRSSGASSRSRFSHGNRARRSPREVFQEARVIGQISHPCILALHDMGIDEASQIPYLVMEFVDGQPLDRILEKGAVPFPRACAGLATSPFALSVAHRKGVIHGDVKPRISSSPRTAA